MHRKIWALVAALISTPVFGEEPGEKPTEAMETITVSATPVRLADTGSAVNIITRRDILNRNAPSIQSLLREIPGLAVNQQGSEGALSQVRVRGAEANQVLVLINGIAANDPAQGGEFDFSQISSNDIERIEIVRGPQSALWGSDAMAGVIHIITTPDIEGPARPDAANQGGRKTSFNASLEAGSFATRRATFAARRVSAGNQVRFAADYLDTDGTNISRTGNEDDGLDNLTLGLSGRYAVSDTLSLGYTARHTDKTSEFDATDAATGLPADAANKTDARYLYAGVSLKHSISERFEHELDVARTDADNTTTTPGPVTSATRGTRDAVRYQFNVIGNANRLSLLLEREAEDYRQRGEASAFGDPNQNRNMDTTSIAAEYRHDADRFGFSFSARRDDNSAFDDADTWRLTGNVKLPGVTWYASIGESVKNPTFTERFGFFTNFAGNPDLKPEQSLHWEIGARASLLDDRAQVTLTWFDASLDNEINGFVFDPGLGAFTSANVDGESKRQGAEVELSYAPGDSIDLRAAYTYLDATQEDAGRDVTEVRRPEHSGAVSVNYAGERGGLNLAISYTGEQEDDFFPPFPPFRQRIQLAAYTLISLTAHYHVNDLLTVTARLENLADEHYEQVFGFESPGFGGYIGLRAAW